MKILPKSLNILNILHPNIFFIIYFIFFLLLYPFVFYKWVPFFSLNGITLVIIILYLSFFVFGSLWSYFFIVKRKKIYIGPIVNDLKNWKIVFYIFYVLGILCFVYFYTKVGTIPILTEDVETNRVTLKAGLGKYVILGTSFLTVSLVVLFAEKKICQKLSLIDYFYLLIASGFILGVGFRGPVAKLYLIIYLTTIFVSLAYRRSLKIGYKTIFLGFIILIILSIIGYIRYTGNIDIKALYSVFWTMAVNVFNINNIVENIPKNFDYWYGKTFIHDIGAVFHFHNEGFLGVYLKNIFGLEFKGEGMTVTAPGEAYINLGYVGVVIHALILSVLGNIIYFYFIRKNKLSYYVLLIIFTVNFPSIVMSGITPTLFFSLLPQVVLVFGFIMFSKIKI